MMKKLLIGFCVALSGVASAQMSNGLVASYNLNGQANDKVSGLNAVLQGDASYIEDRFGNADAAVGLASGTGLINLGDSPSFEMTDAYTVSMWIDQDGPGSGGAGVGTLFNREGEYEAGIEPDGEIKIAISTTSKASWAWTDTGIKIDTAKWNHVVFTFGGDSAKVFLNGAQVFSKYEPGTIDEISGGSVSTGPLDELQFGGREAYLSSANFNGKMDDIHVFDVALNAQAIADLYQVEMTEGVAGLVASYGFDGDAFDDLKLLDAYDNGAMYVEDRHGNVAGAVKLNGTTDFINMTAAPAFEMTDAYSVAMWIDQDGRHSGVAPNYIGHLYNREGEYEAGITGSGQLIIAHSTTSKASWAWEYTGISIDTTVWNHVVFTFGGDSAKVYLNGTQVYSVLETGNIDEQGTSTNSQDEFQLGSRQAFPGEGNFNGKMDDVKIYNIALTANDVFGMYENEKVITGISSSNEISLNIFPNPATANISVSGVDVASMELVSLSGVLVKVSDSSEMNIEEIQNGMYLLNVITIEGAQVVERVVKQ